MALIEPLDLYSLLVTTFAGNMYLFVILAIITIGCLAAYFKMNLGTLGMMIILFSVLIGAWASWFLFLVTLITGLVIYFIIGRIIKQ